MTLRRRTARRRRPPRSWRSWPARSQAVSARRITALREHRGGRVEVDLDGTPWRRLPADAVVRAGLGVGRELDRPLARTLARELRRSGALTRATRALAARDRSRQALEQRLGAAGVAAAARAEALDALERAGLVDDARFAAGRAEVLAARGWGDAGIRAELEREGVQGEAAAAAIAGLEPERERAGRLVSLRGRGPATARYLAGRGFGEDSVEAALDGVVAWDT